MKETLEALAAGGTALLDWTLRMNLWTLLLFVGAATTDRLLARRVSARVRLVLYAAVAIRLLVPSAWLARVGSRQLAPLTVLVGLVPGGPAGAATHAGSQATSPAWIGMLVPVYAVGVAILLAFAGIRRRRLARVVAEGRPARPELALLAPGVEIIEHPQAGPAAFGLVRPRIVLPCSLAGTLGAPALRSVVRHEAVHAARRDPLLYAFLQLVATLAWPVVPVWLALVRARKLIEIGCDEAVLAGADPATRREYGDALLQVASLRPSGARLVPAPAFDRDLSARLRELSWSRRWRAPVQLAAVSLATASFVLLVGPAATRAAAPDPDESLVTLDIDLYRIAEPVARVESMLPASVVPTRGDGISAWLVSGKPPELLELQILSAPRVTALPGQSAMLQSTDQDGNRITTSIVSHVSGPDLILDLTLAAGENTARLVGLSVPAGKAVLVAGDGLPLLYVALARPILPARNRTISLDVKDIDLFDLLDRFASSGGYNLIVDDDVPPSRVTLRLDSEPWEFAFGKVCVDNGFVARFSTEGRGECGFRLVEVTSKEGYERRHSRPYPTEATPRLPPAEPISVDLKQAAIGDVLAYFAEVSHLRLQLDSSVAGTVTARFIDVPWDRVLTLILASHDLSWEERDGVLHVKALEATAGGE